MAEEKVTRKGPGAIGKFYLILYNIAQTLGWTAILVKTVQYYNENKSLDGFYKEIDEVLKIFQTAAILEVLHCIVGLVPSSAFLTGFQVASRLLIFWGVIKSVEEVQDDMGVPLAVVAWTITEIIRYSFYFFNLIGSVPYPLLWCRYTFFIVLYPCGVTGELLSLKSSLPYVVERKLYSYEMPNHFNMSFNYYYTLLFIAFLYIPVFPQLYGHMLGQRKKCLGSTQKSTKTD